MIFYFKLFIKTLWTNNNFCETYTVEPPVKMNTLMKTVFTFLSLIGIASSTDLSNATYPLIVEKVSDLIQEFEKHGLSFEKNPQEINETKINVDIYAAKIHHFDEAREEVKGVFYVIQKWYDMRFICKEKTFFPKESAFWNLSTNAIFGPPIELSWEGVWIEEVK